MKKFIYYLIPFLLIACNQQSKKTSKNENPVNEVQQILVVNYELNEMTLEDHSKLGSEVISNFMPGKIEGLIGKTFIGNIEKGIFGGVYYFKNQTSLKTYLDSELWKGIVAHPNLVNFKTDEYGIAPISANSNGLASQRKMSNNPIDAEGMQILVVNYELNEMTLEDHSKLGSEVISNFMPGKIEGLIGKTFIGNIEKGIFGGVYYFKNQTSLKTYLDSELWKGIVAHPNLVNFKTDEYGVAPISANSNGVPVF